MKSKRLKRPEQTLPDKYDAIPFDEALRKILSAPPAHRPAKNVAKKSAKKK